MEMMRFFLRLGRLCKKAPATSCCAESHRSASCSARRYTSDVVANTGLLRENESQTALPSLVAPTFSLVRSRPAVGLPGCHLPRCSMLMT